MDLLKAEDARVVSGRLNYRENGLVTVVTQDASTGEVLIVAFANREAVERTLSTGKVHYWSRSRRALWQKGETSGNYQYVQGVYVDCDMDTLLIKVRQVNGACHLGYKTCFFRRVEGLDFTVVPEVEKWET